MKKKEENLLVKIRNKFPFKTTVQKWDQVCLKHLAKDTVGGSITTFWTETIDFRGKQLEQLTILTGFNDTIFKL